MLPTRTTTSSNVSALPHPVSIFRETSSPVVTCKCPHLPLIGECAFLRLCSHDQFHCGAFLAVILIPGVFAKSPESLRGVSIPKFLASVAASSTCVSGRAGPRIATF